MKKNYVRPESRLYAINLAENIANSGIGGDGTGTGAGTGDAVNGMSVIKFTHGSNGCRMYYTGDTTAVVTQQSGSFADYFNELNGLAASNPAQYAITYWNCFTFSV